MSLRSFPLIEHLTLDQYLGNNLHFLSHFVTGTPLKPEPVGPSASKFLFYFLASKGTTATFVRTVQNTETPFLCCSV